MRPHRGGARCGGVATGHAGRTGQSGRSVVHAHRSRRCGCTRRSAAASGREQHGRRRRQHRPRRLRGSGDPGRPHPRGSYRGHRGPDVGLAAGGGAPPPRSGRGRPGWKVDDMVADGLAGHRPSRCDVGDRRNGKDRPSGGSPGKGLRDERAVQQPQPSRRGSRRARGDAGAPATLRLPESPRPLDDADPTPHRRERSGSDEALGNPGQHGPRPDRRARRVGPSSAHRWNPRRRPRRHRA